MNNFTKVARRFERVFTDNSPLIFTALGVAGTVTTALLTGRASFRAAQILEDDRVMHRVHGEPTERNRKEKFRMLWTLYIPAVATGTLTCGSIIFAHNISSRRAATVAAAYMISQETLSEFRHKAQDILTEKQYENIEKEIVQDRVRRHGPDEGTIVHTGNGKVVMQDAYSGRYFLSEVESVRRAENNVRELLYIQDHISISDFYDEVGLEHTVVSDDFGWTVDTGFELKQIAIIVEDEHSPFYKQPCISWVFTEDPVLRPWQFR